MRYVNFLGLILLCTYFANAAEIEKITLTNNDKSVLSDCRSSNVEYVADNVTSVKVQNNSLSDTIAVLCSISNNLDKMRGYLEKMKSKFKNDTEFSSEKARNDFMANKLSVIEIIVDLDKLPKEIFSKIEQMWLFDKGDMRNTYNGVLHAVGTDLNKASQPDRGGCILAIKYTDNAKKSIDNRIEALKAKKNELEKEKTK